MKTLCRRVSFYIFTILLSLCQANNELIGPAFRLVPPFNVQFSNDTGTKVDCTAFGNPVPQIQWYLEDGTRVMTIPRIRVVHQNGSLIFLRFGPSSYMHDVHSAQYRCKASNAVGQIVSGAVHVNAVMNQNYEVQVYAEYITIGNTALLRCHVSAYASSYVMVTSWIQDDIIHFYPNVDSGGKYLVLGNGDLYINNVDSSDGYKSYTCRTVHKLTGEIKTSAFPGHITVNEPTGSQRPRVVVETDSRKHIKVGDDLTLSCLAHGFPIPIYRWYKENGDILKPLAHDPRFSVPIPGLLKIEKIRLDDDGKYVCITNNTVAEETVHHSVFVTEPLSVNITPQKVIGSSLLDPTKSVQFVCTVNGHPINRIMWYKNGQPLIQLSGRVRVQSSLHKQELTLSPLSKDDQGMYQCFGTNDWDMAHDNTQLLLGDIGPELVYWFTEQTLQPGPSLSLKCVASGNPLPQFTWTLDGFPIPESNRIMTGQYVTARDDVIAHVNISSLKVEDGGEYTCIAHNEIAQVSHSSRINVYGFPYVREMPSVHVVAGKQLVVKCPVAGYPIESINWERDGATLPVNIRQKVYSNGTLTIDQVQRQIDAGTYTCQAKNHHGRTSRRDVDIQVLIRPKILPIPPMTNLLAEGMRAAISCQIVEGDLPVMFTWKKDGDGVNNDLGVGTTTRNHDEYSSSLIIERITAEHAGNYTCIATNAAGGEKFTVPLTVNVPPKWTVEPEDINVIMGYPCMLHCQAEGYPTPTVVWKKSFGDSIGEYKDFLYEPNVNFFRNGTLEFLHTSKTNDGKYMCEAKNGISPGLSKVVQLKINTPVKFIQKTKQIQVKINNDAHIQCTAVGDKPLKITWKGSTNMPILKDMDRRFTIREQSKDNGLMSELGISPVYRHDSGFFKCSGSNFYGQDENSVELVVQETPESPKDIRIVNQQSRSMEITWNKPYDGNSVILNYIVQYKLVASLWTIDPVKVIVPGTQTVTVIEGLTPATAYHIRVLAENGIGTSEPSDESQAITQEEAPSMAPQNVRAEAKSTTELLIMWEPPPTEACNGILIGYHVGYLPMDDAQNAAQSSAPSSLNRYVMKTININSQYDEDLVIDGLTPYTTYSIVLQAYNSKGPGPFSKPITVQTDEGVPTMPPEKPECRSLTSQSIEVTWVLPPQTGRNGKIIGFKVSYQPAEEWYENNEFETKITAVQHTSIQALLKYTNYSISILAYTSKGDGVPSEPVYCKTDEDTPSVPADIKAVISSIKTIIVSWLPPLRPNGKLTGYILYISILSGHKDSKPTKKMLGASVEMFEASRILDSTTYQFWVKAQTKVGEGASTKIITVLPTIKIPAQIISFSQVLIMRWKKNVTLNCKRVGVPFPEPIWTKGGRSITSSGRYQINKDGSLAILDVQHSDRGNYTCAVENTHGKDEIVYSVNVRVPPSPPKLTVHLEETDSLQLKWIDTAESDTPILGYVINYKRDHGDWEEIHIDSQTHFHVLQKLLCGTRYQLYITAYNKIGTGLPCDILTSYTKGSVPVPPESPSEAITYNSTTVSAWFDLWGSGGCDIQYYTIEWKQSKSNEWILCDGNIAPTERMYTVGDLEPASQYQLKVVAHNNIGTAFALYNFTTLTIDGATVMPFDFYTEITPEEASVFTSITTAISLIIALVVVSSIAAFTYYYKVMKHSEDESLRDQSQRSRDQRYSVRGQSQQTLSCDSVTFKTDSTEYMDDICPYATFELAKQPQGESTFSGNIYSGPYHSVRGSFVYHQPKASTSEAYNFVPRKEPEYTKVRQKGRKLRDPHSESQESDNLGSTDSEVKRILTLHLPISEYDTHGSDSDNGEVRRNQSTSQELVSFRHRMSREVSNEDSSSSSENSVAEVRKPPTMSALRKPKSKSQIFTKRPLKNSGGFTSHSEGIDFSERLNPPARFSDSRPMRQNEGNEFERRPKISSHQRRSPRRLTQETSFQIDV
ncbi:Fibronectin type III,Immunoglobulin subtype,Immunoglobulin-like domain,Immunoglobulin-like [Cinara cedri]|uniref:Fibronectin type III,Immunoglobulin subtype,Immunoglobulin-like domain,Immunoglobulin-like n=1 Tax=Cinara cedri TaxID=506608 RepID=A0A5E4MET2_9HEMI|nr:Fibronectin type III,Immunoglobulin subtype,Immunoglobulin-like domain,Immunoglobulin-like [Cinara cedri]